ncbi:MAG: efflux RND transporter periplasmic adaptor subunit, partial [Candidatus Omnitrophica bacterium]|nr:efflux RND transporter periplasmic adaptor subunit [Candidatus Omnitrophota bacterium]
KPKGDTKTPKETADETGAKTEKKPSPQQATTPETKKEENQLKNLSTADLPPIMVRVFKIKPVDFQDNLPVMGTVKGKTEVQLRFEISGTINKINFREGEKVRKGDVIACLDPKDVQLKYSYAKNKFNSAQATANSAKKRLEVFQKLFEVGAVLKTKLEEMELEYESAKYQVETSRSEMDLSENELTKTCITASKDGLMGPRDAEEGEFITPQDKVGILYEIKEVYVEVGVVERDIDKIKIGQQAKVYVDAYQKTPFEGTVEYIYPVVEGKSRTLTVKIKVNNPENALLPGMFSRADIKLYETKNAIIVPATSVSRVGNQIQVPLVPAETIQTDADGVQIGVVQVKRVTLAYETSDYVQIATGVKPNDLIITEAQGEIKDGAKVKVVGIDETSL